MKAAWPIYLIIMILLITACRDGSIDTKQQAAVHAISKNYTPEWGVPQQRYSWYEAPIISPEIVFTDPVPQAIPPPEVIVKRDTIRGIAVRDAKAIPFPTGDNVISEREIEDDVFYAMAYTSTNRYISVSFDNDIFNNTDYYYTNGINITYIAPIFASSPLSYSMLPYKKYSMNYHGMSFVQNMYTPTNPDTTTILVGDRPFAAYLYLGHFKNTLSSRKRYRQYSELQIGLIGPGSLGGFVQAQIHDIEPVGWENQIQNDMVLNYTVEVEKGLYNPGPFDLNIFGRGQIGTLYDNLGTGVRVRLGRFNPYFEMPWLAGKNSIEGTDGHNWQYGIFASAMAQVIFYNATLQGGLFNSNNNYTIPAEDLERIVLQASAGIYIAYQQFGLTYEQFYVSPEFKEAYDFRWGHLNLTYCF